KLCSVEVVAFNIAGIDQSSIIGGTTGNLGVVLAKGLEPERSKLAYRVYAGGAATVRDVINGKDLKWKDDDTHLTGRTTLTVLTGAVINCTAIYDGVAYAHFWVADPEKTQNPRRAVYETFDPKLENLKALIANASLRGQDARQLESAIAWLFWLL